MQVGHATVVEGDSVRTGVTACVWAAAEGLADVMLHRPGESRHTINPLVGETNDSRVNDMWADPIRTEHVRAALEAAASGSRSTARPSGRSSGPTPTPTCWKAARAGPPSPRTAARS
ncbi:MAG TPA: P1 family peptidase [Longimicrobiales bacterium]|nr:P1 family peptidase [Longimicrobiales bacterium]